MQHFNFGQNCGILRARIVSFRSLAIMAKSNFSDELKAKFRVDESALDQEIDAALAACS